MEVGWEKKSEVNGDLMYLLVNYIRVCSKIMDYEVFKMDGIYK